jgi:hypothetical protein
MPRHSVFLWGLAILFAAGVVQGAQNNVAINGGSHLQATVFATDITPPLGDGVGIGFMPETLSVEHSLSARGIVLRDAGGTYVLCALDLCGLCNDSYDLFRERIARAAGTQPSHVAVQSLHQHTAPIFDTSGHRILYRKDPRKLARGLQFADSTADNIAKAARKAMNSFQPVTHVGTSKARVERVASNRRIAQPDGTLLTRLSSTKDPTLQAAPEGLIDPWLRTVTFYNQDKPLVQLHYYATHPQSFYRDGRISYDVPGIALERVQKETGVAQVYFTGCGGNVAMGKYNDGTREARSRLASRLYDAMARSAKAQDDKQPVTTIRWKTKAVSFPLRNDEAFSAETQRRILADSKSSFRRKLKAAMVLAWIERVEAGRPVQFSCLSISHVRLLHLPGEPFVQFQFAAQKAGADSFVAVAGCGDCAMWYIGEDRIYTDRGGFEQSWALAGPCEKLIETTICELLQP